MRDRLKIMLLWQMFLWVIGAQFTLGVHWVLMSKLSIEWIAFDAFIATVAWPLTLGVDLVRLWEMFA